MPWALRASQATGSLAGRPGTRRNSDEVARFQRLTEWVRAQGGRVGPVVLASSDGLRGLAVTEDVEPGRELLFVPRRCWMQERVRSLLPAAVAERVALKSLLAWQLCQHHRRRAPKWRSYLDMLPAGLVGHPLACAPADLETLPRVLRKAVEMTQQSARQDYDALCEALPSAPPDRDRFAWAFLCVSSRAFAESPTDAAMIPLVDLMNHAFAPTCRVRVQADGAHVLALRELPARTPTTWTYARAPNVLLFCAYGFCCADHPHDRMPVSGPAFTRRLHDHLVQAGPRALRTWTLQIPAAFDDERSRCMLTAIRSTLRMPFLLTEAGVQPAPEADEAARAPASRSEELAAMAELASLCDGWSAALDDHAAPAADAGAQVLAMSSMTARLAASMLRIIGHFAALSRAAAAALHCDRREDAFALLLSLPDAAYADELRQHADRLWPLHATP